MKDWQPLHGQGDPIVTRCAARVYGIWCVWIDNVQHVQHYAAIGNQTACTFVRQEC